MTFQIRSLANDTLNASVMFDLAADKADTNDSIFRSWVAGEKTLDVRDYVDLFLETSAQ